MPAYYNEIDPNAAAWIKELVRNDLVANGEVDTRDIRDVVPEELLGRTQCHFFAGIAAWSYALRLAGWDDDRPAWTGSCPCQSFSQAGKRKGFTDERHLWPSWFHLIEQCRPPVVFGEQVASGSSKDWLDLVHTDMEAIGYAFGAVVLPAAGVGAPHVRSRIFFVADADRERRQGKHVLLRAQEAGRNEADFLEAPGCGETRDVADAGRDRIRGEGHGAAGATPTGVQGTDGQRKRFRIDVGTGGSPAAVGLADSSSSGLEVIGEQQARRQLSPTERGVKACGLGHTDRFGEGEVGRVQKGPRAEPEGDVLPEGHRGSSPTNGFWRDADWLRCRDGKWRPVKPGTFPLVDGASAGMVRGGDSGISVDSSPEARTARIKGYGNSIVVQAAAAFIKAYMESNRTCGSAR